MFVLKHAIEHQEFFTQFMLVRTEAGMRCVANQTGCTCNLIAISLQHFSIHTVDG